VYQSEGVIEQIEGRDDVVIKAAVKVEGNQVLVDLEGSSGHVDWGGNVVFNFTYAYVFMALKSMLDPDMPNNDGCTRPIALKAPEASVVNCSFPVAVAARMQIGHFLTEIVYRALARAVPHRVIAASGGTPASMNVFYGQRSDGRPFHSVIIRGGGMGASHGADGEYDYIFPANGANTPVEILESDTPLLVECRELLPDSGGPGRTMGGPGRQVTFRVPDDETAPAGQVSLGIQSGRYRYPPEGLFGGGEGGRARFLVNGHPGNPYGLTRLKPGDRVSMHAAGGGGYGDPLERDPELVARDVAEGLVSPQAARESYGVVIDADSGQVNAEATRVLRKSMGL
jgi:N-methylhydantoinase B